MMNATKLFLLMLLNTMGISLFAVDIQHFTGTFHIEETCLDATGYVFSDEKDIHFTAGDESDLLFAMPSNGVNGLNAFVDGDSIFIPLQWWNNYDDTQASFAGKGKMVNDSIFLHYGAGGAFGVVDCDCKGEKIKKQAEEYSGKLVRVPNPCTGIPCLPGVVWALETAENIYVLSFNNHWMIDNLVIDNTEYSMEDSVVISGTVHHKYDINNTAYIELEIEEIALTGQATGNTIVLPNSSWSVLRYGLFFQPWVSTQYIYFDEDSIVTGKTYKKVFSCDDELHENIKYEGLIREQDKKTYFIGKNSETEYLLYDFSLEEGANFEYQEQGSQIPGYEFPSIILYVKKVDFVEISGVQKKRIQLTSLPPDDDIVRATWIESIGSLTGLFYPQGSMRSPSNVIETLLCHFQDNESVYKDPAFSKCYYDKEEDIIYDEKENDIYENVKITTLVKSIQTSRLTVYPNPVDNVLIISPSNEVVSFVRFTDMLGKTVYTKRLDADKEYNIDMSLFVSGLYFLHIYDVKGHVSTFKIIKK
jgi:hypothetical protein